MKKRLDTSSIVNELSGQSAFFPTYKRESRPEVVKKTDVLPLKIENRPKTTTSSEPTSKQESLQASNHASTLATPENIIEIIRKVVKTPAKEEVLYVRVTKEEKLQLGDIEYTYERQDIATSANELGRIAINFLIADYKVSGENSILAKVLKALHA